MAFAQFERYNLRGVRGTRGESYPLPAGETGYSLRGVCGAKKGTEMLKLKPIKSYTMKVRLYPNKKQAETIDIFLLGAEKAMNMTMYAMSQHDPRICTTKDGTVWPDFYRMASLEWLSEIRTNNELVAKLPGSAMSGQTGGLFRGDLKKMWESHGKLPIDKWFEKRNDKGKRCLKYYKNGKRKHSYYTQITAKQFRQDGNKVYVKAPILGEIRIRGWNDKIKFGEAGDKTFFEFYEDSKTALSCRILKDTCGDYFLSITLANVWRPIKENEAKDAVGIDLNVSEDAYVVSTANGKYPNPRWKKSEAGNVNAYKTMLSGRHGFANREFREERKKVRAENTRRRKAGIEELLPDVVPSKRYEKAQAKDRRLERKIARRRNDYQHIISVNEVASANLLCTESLNVSGMLRNNNLSESISDSAFSMLLGKLRYKAEWAGVPLQQIGMWEPSSHICPDCGYRMEGEEKFGLEVRAWVCPDCGCVHDRDEAAARNIRRIGIEYYLDDIHELDGTIKGEEKKPRAKTPPKDKALDKNHPHILIRYSPEMKAEYKNPWIIVAEDGTVLDDAQGCGYDTAQKAGKAYRHKLNTVLTAL